MRRTVAVYCRSPETTSIYTVGTACVRMVGRSVESQAAKISLKLGSLTAAGVHRSVGRSPWWWSLAKGEFILRVFNHLNISDFKRSCVKLQCKSKQLKWAGVHTLGLLVCGPWCRWDLDLR